MLNLRLFLSFILLAIVPIYLFAQPTGCNVGFDRFSAVTSESFRAGSQYADADNDGDLDFFAFRPRVTGEFPSPPQIRLFRNNGTSFSFFLNIVADRFDIADINGDGRLDLVAIDPDIGNSLRLHINTGTSFSPITIYTAPTNVVFEGAPQFVDYDNDGDLDISCGIFRRSNGAVFILENDGQQNFTQKTYFGITGTGLDRVKDVKWGDIDNDGDQDCFGLFAGLDAAGAIRTFPDIYLNRGDGTFNSASATPPSADFSLLEDFDNDGTVDMIVWGNGTGSSLTGNSFRFYRGGSSGTAGFVGSTSVGTNQHILEINTFDYDNNGFLDLFVYSYDGQTFATRQTIFRNTNGNFSFWNTQTNSIYSAPFYVDYNKDNVADYSEYLITTNSRIEFFRGNGPQSTCPTNSRPKAPASLNASVDGNNVTLSWQGSDADQASAALTYEIYLANQTTGQVIFAPSSDQSTGIRKIAAPGRHGSKGSWTFRNLPNGNYAWRVQAIDHFYSGSFWSFGDFQIGQAGCPDYLPGTTVEGGFSKESKWGDYDNDGDKDLFIIHDNGDNAPHLHLIQNDNGNLVTADPWNENEIQVNHFDLGDADNDGDIDILFVDNVAMYVLVNENGSFGRKDIYSSVEGWTSSRPEWIDYDNDGDLDIVHFQRVFFTQFNGLAFYENKGDFQFESNYTFPIANNRVLDLRVADFDRDGDVDIITEESNPNIADLPRELKLYLNDGGPFIPGPTVGVTGQGIGGFDIGDFDNDGDLDVIGSGRFQFGASTRLYQNNNLDFVEIIIQDDGFGHVRLGDYNNDGFLDLAASTYEYSSSPANPNFVQFTQLFQNTGGTSLLPENINFTVPGFQFLKVGVLPEWVDFNNDGILDIYHHFFATYNESNTEVVFNDVGLLHINKSSCLPNTPPNPPTGLNVDINGSNVVLSWKEAFDPEQTPPSLSYKVFLYDSQGKIIVQPHANPDKGYRQLTEMGNQFQNTKWPINNLPDGSYCFKVQAIDHTFEGGLWSEVLCFDISSCQLVAEAIAIPPRICEGESATLRATSSGANGSVTYQWSNGLGIGPSVTVSPTSTTVYTVTATDGAGCVAIDTTTVVVNPRPFISAGPDTSICLGESVLLSAIASGGSGSGYDFLWDNGLGAGPSHTVAPTATTTYNVIVRDENNCTNTDQVTVTVNLPPSISAGPDTSICLGESVLLSAIASGGSGGGYDFLWDNGLGAGPSHNVAPTATTTYNVIVRDENNCTNTDQVTVTVNLPPSISAGPDTSICLGESVLLSAIASGGSGGGYDFLWDNGLGAGPSHTVAPTATTTYNVIVRDENNCTNTDQVTVTVNTPPSLAFEVTPADCAASNGIISAFVDGGTAPFSYAWDNGDNTATISNLAFGVYNLIVTDGAGCTVTGSATVEENNTFSVQAIALPDNLCLGDSTQLGALVSGGVQPYTFNWSNDLGTDSIVTAIPTQSATYILTVQDANGCQGIAEVSVTVFAPPILSLSPDTSICVGGSALLIAQGNGGDGNYTYNWDNNLGNGPNQTVSPTLTTLYGVTLSDGNGCSDTSAVLVTVNENPIVDAGPDTTICLGNAVDLNATASGGNGDYTFDWDNNLGDGAFHTVTPTVSTTFTVTLTDGNNCTASDQILLTINEPPVVNAGPDTTICLGENITLIASASGGSDNFIFNWDNGLGDGPTQNVSPTTTTTYVVTLTDGNTYQATDTITVLVNPVPTFTFEPAQCDASLTTYHIDIQTESTNVISASLGEVTDNGGGSFSVTDVPAGETLTLTITDPNTECFLIQTIPAPECSCPDNIPAPLSDGDPSICEGDDIPTLSVRIPDTLSVNWYDAAIGGQLLFQSSTTFIPDQAGTYYAESFIPNNGCSNSNRTAVSLTIFAPPTISIDGDTTLCADGTSLLTASGAATYSWNTGENTPTITVSQGGIYSVVGTDDNTCTSTASISVLQAEPLSGTFSKEDVLCNGESSGMAMIDMVGGTSPYTYLWSNGAASATNEGLAAGTYSVVVTDSHQCTFEGSVTITENDPLNIEVSTTAASCQGEANGSINLVVTGGIPNYQFLWEDQSTSASRDNLPAGTYTVTVTDGNDCTQIATATISEASSLFIEGINTVNVSCFALSNGSIEVEVGGGTAPYTLRWSNDATTTLISQLAAGDYSLTLTDANECQNSSSFSITQPESLNISDAQINNASCEGATNGNINLTINGGTLPYAYNWSNGSSSEDLAGVAAGTYNVTVTDANNCDVRGNFTVGNAGTIDLSLTPFDATCQEENGRIELVVDGGTAPYAYDWSNDGTGDNDDPANIAGLGAGAYTLALTDANGCVAFSEATTINNKPIPVIQLVEIISATCGQSNGSADIEVISGTAPYTYQWSNGTSNQDLSNAPEGEYTVSVTDGDACPVSFTLGILCNNPCVVNVGTMGEESLSACQTESLTATYDATGEVLGEGDLRQFVIHNGSGNSLGSIVYGQGDEPVATFLPDQMIAGQTYYISAVVGKNDGNGNVDLSNACLAVAAGTPFTFARAPSALAELTATNTVLCVGQTLDLAVNVPFEGDISYLWETPRGVFTTSTPTLKLEVFKAEDEGDYFASYNIDGCESEQLGPLFIALDDRAKEVSAGEDQVLCGINTLNLAAQLPANTTGSWFTSSPAFIAEETNPNTRVDSLGNGDNIFIWVVNTGSCIVRDSMVIYHAIAPTTQDRKVLLQADKAALLLNKEVLFDAITQTIPDSQLVFTIIEEPAFGLLKDTLNGLYYLRDLEVEEDLDVSFTYQVCNVDPNCDELCSEAEVTITIKYLASEIITYKRALRPLGNNPVWKFTLLRNLSDARLTIVDRWGQVIYSQPFDSNEYDLLKGNTIVGWDGENNKGVQLPSGAYYFIFEGTLADGTKPSPEKGIIYLMK
ncbi:MAG: FG-GAP-like repeat-containing protein [Saprospiraceae bacterium]